MGKALQDEYLLGTDDVELNRLRLQHVLWAPPTTAHWERAAFAPGQRILDLGCGPGFTSLELATIVGPQGSVLAADSSSKFLTYLDQLAHIESVNNIETLQADAQELDLPPNSLDGAYARWLMCFIPEPELVIQRLASALKPGATFAVMDYFNYQSLTLAPRCPAFARVIDAVTESWRASGGDLDIAGKLPTLLAKHNIETREVRPLNRVARAGSALWQWPTSFFTSYIPRLVEMGLLTQTDADQWADKWAKRSRDPHTYFITPQMLEIIAVKRS